MPADSAPLNFAEGDNQVSKPAATVLREFLAGLPKPVDFSEKSLNDIAHAINETSYRMSERSFRAAESPKVRLKAEALAARLEQNPQPIKVVVKGPKR